MGQVGPSDFVKNHNAPEKSELEGGNGILYDYTVYHYILWKQGWLDAEACIQGNHINFDAGNDFQIQIHISQGLTDRPML